MDSKGSREADKPIETLLSMWAAAMARRKASLMTTEERVEHGRKMALARWSKARATKKRR